MTTEVITALTALAAVIVSPLVSIYVVRREVNSQVRSANRQVWINELRERVATFLTETSLSAPAMGNLEAGIQAQEERRRRIRQLAFEISLYVNPNETDHARLVELITAVAAASAQVADTTLHRPEIISTTQGILKREWNRVKAGE